MTDLGTLPNGTISLALSINDLGQIVGSGATASRATHAVLWTTAAPPAFDFSLAAPSPGALTVVQGSTSPSSSINATLVSGTTGPVTFSASGLPSGVTATFKNNPCDPICTATVSFSATSTATVGTRTVSIDATGGGAAHSTSLSLTVLAASTGPFVIYTLVLVNNTLVPGNFLAANGFEPTAVAYDSGKGEVFVTDKGSNAVSVISDTTNAVVASIPVGSSPFGVAYDSAKGEVFVANQGSGTVTVISDGCGLRRRERRGVRREPGIEQRQRHLGHNECRRGQHPGGFLAVRSGLRQREGGSIRREPGIGQRDRYLRRDERRRGERPGGFRSAGGGLRQRQGRGVRPERRFDHCKRSLRHNEHGRGDR